MEGWIKIHRGIMSWEWYRDACTSHLFLHLLLQANHEETKWRGETIEIGQVVTTLADLSSQTGLSVQQIRTCLTRLERTGEISRKSTNKFSILTISNYERYQLDQQATNNQSTNNQQTNNKQITNKAEKEREKEESSKEEIREERELYKNERNNITHTIAHAHEGGMFILSSVEKASCAFSPDAMAQLKRRKMEERLAIVEGNLFKENLFFTESSRRKFLDFYCEHTDGSPTIRAETYTSFNLYARAKKWIETDNEQRQTASRKQTTYNNQNSLPLKDVDALWK